eukprot:3100398-Pyramimonas_sp.AAC.1
MNAAAFNISVVREALAATMAAGIPGAAKAAAVAKTMAPVSVIALVIGLGLKAGRLYELRGHFAGKEAVLTGGAQPSAHALVPLKGFLLLVRICPPIHAYVSAAPESHAHARISRLIRGSRMVVHSSPSPGNPFLPTTVSPWP